MDYRTSCLAGLFACAVALPSATPALEPAWKSTGATSTAVSGYSGQLQVLELGTADGYAMTGLSSHEAANRPCDITVLSDPLDANSTVEADRLKASRCTSTSSGMDVFFLSNPRYFVRGLAVCSSKTGNERRMKGYKVIAAKVWQTKAQIDELATSDTDQRNNCAGDWHETVYCPQGEVASGVNVYWAQDEDAIVGLGLRCRKVAWKA